MSNGMNFLVALKKWHTALLYSDKKAFQLESGTHGWPETLLGQPTSEAMWSFLNRYTLTAARVQHPSVN
jgi:hypothetical protein